MLCFRVHYLFALPSHFASLLPPPGAVELLLRKHQRYYCDIGEVVRATGSVLRKYTNACGKFSWKTSPTHPSILTNSVAKHLKLSKREKYHTQPNMRTHTHQRLMLSSRVLPPKGREMLLSRIRILIMIRIRWKYNNQQSPGAFFFSYFFVCYLCCC